MSQRIGPAAPGVTVVEVDEQVSVLSPVTSEVLMLNGTASDIWRLADGEHTLDELVDLLARNYGVDRAGIRDDVAATVQRFVDAGLLEAGPAL